MRKVRILRSVQEPVLIDIRVRTFGVDEDRVQKIMRLLAEAIKKENRQLAKTGGEQMNYRIELG